MMLYGEKIKVLGVLLLVFSFLFLACCNKKSVEPSKFITEEETKQEVAITTQRHTEQPTYKTIEKNTPITKENDVITTIINDSADNEIVFDTAEENINVSSTINATDEPAKNEHTTNEHSSQPTQTVTEPATDSDGWVTKWY